MRKAQSSLAIMVALTIVMIEVSVLISTVSLSHFYNKEDALSATNALTLVDSGLEEALYRLRQDSSYSGGTLALPQGTVQIAVTPFGAQELVQVTTQGTSTYRQLSAYVDLEEIVDNPLEQYALFSGDNVRLRENAIFYGNLYANDNIRIEDNAILYGEGYLAGDGAQSDTRVTDNAQVLGNPLTMVLEGHLYSVDDIRIQNSGYVQRDAWSEKRVIVQQSGVIDGSIYEFQDLDLPSVPIPQFDFDAWEAVAQVNGTHYSSPSQFLSYLSLNGYVVPEGIHFIDSTSTLTIPAGTTVDFTGSLVSRGTINIQSTNYTHNADSNFNLPLIASKSDVNITDAASCACNAVINGAIFAEDDVNLDYDQHTGGGPGIEVNGVIWGGDDVNIDSNVVVIYDDAVPTTMGDGFEFAGGGTGVSNISIVSWSIE